MGANKISPFQIILLVAFGFIIIIAVMIFSGAINLGSKNQADTLSGKVVIWGFFPSSTMREVISPIQSKYENLTISYVEKNYATFGADLSEALASGNGPDMFMVTSDTLLRDLNKSFTTSFDTYPLRTYRNTFVEGAELFLGNDGVMAFPLTIDPLVLYWNRDMFNSAGIVSPPATWGDLYKIVPTLSEKTSQGILSKSAISLGEYDNVTHAKDILSMFFIQTGNKIVTRDSDGSYYSTLSATTSGGESPGASIIRFYTDFSNPSSDYFSWSKSLPDSKDYFIAGNLAMYIGYASEVYDIRAKNPNLNFDVTRIPQLESSSNDLTFGRVYGITTTRNTAQRTAAFYIAQDLSSSDSVALLSSFLKTIPVRRDLLSSLPADPYINSFYQSALLARSWYDPNPTSTSGIFQNMIKDVTTGFYSPEGALKRANDALDNLLR